MKIIYISLFITAAFFLESCTKKDMVKNTSSFTVLNMDPIAEPVITMSPVTGGTKTFVIFASQVKGRITRFQALDASHDFPRQSLTFGMIDPAQPLTIDEKGYLSRPVSSIVFNYAITIPKGTTDVAYSIHFVITNEEGEEKIITGKCRIVDFFTSPTVISLFNGRSVSNAKQYSSAASCFVSLSISLAAVPGAPSAPSGIIYSAVPPSSATGTSRVNAYLFLYTDLSDMASRKMYFVSPDMPWIKDSLKNQNKYTTAYDPALMRNVKLVDLGVIDFVNLKSTDFRNIDFENKGLSQVQVLASHSYAFQMADKRVAIIYAKNIQMYTADYAMASPLVYAGIKVQAYPD